jgi:uncharacterized protein YjeT (DUF2065 family)
MTKVRKIGIILILIGICLPTATLPFITEFRPVPELCLTSNFFQNLGNMVVVFGSKQMQMSSGHANALLSIPYRYLFSIGVILVCTGLGIITVTSGNISRSRG